MSNRSRAIGGAIVAILCLGVARSSAEGNRFWLAAQHSWHAKKGFYLNFENKPNADGMCPIQTLKIVLGVADGSRWRFITDFPRWQLEHRYQIRAVISPNRAELWLDNQRLASSEGQWDVHDGHLTMSHVPSYADGPADYLIEQHDLTVKAGNALVGQEAFPTPSGSIALRLFAEGWSVVRNWRLPADSEVTLTAHFTISKRPALHELAPFVDRYGQSVHATDQKVLSDEQLRQDIVTEDQRLETMPPLPRRDAYGGNREAGWTENATGFFRITRRDGFFWLVSPEGNPCFYVGINSMPATTWSLTPIQNREFLFEWLPPRNPPWNAAWKHNCWGSQDGDYLCLHTCNLIRKYGPETWSEQATERAVRRCLAFGFCGGGKWGTPQGLVRTPVLRRSGVPLLIEHPDVFDQKVRKAFRSVIEKQVAPSRDDPFVLGWSLGNEYAEVIKTKEIRDILAKPAPVPAKRALVDEAYKSIYAGNLAELNQAWNSNAETLKDLYEETTLKPREKDLKHLRRFYAHRYYGFIYETIRELDPNHLYLGFWLSVGWWQDPEDWKLIAQHCDVLGYDQYAWKFDDDGLGQLMEDSGVPVLNGEYSFPPTYDGRRAYGRYRIWSRNDAKAGEGYENWVRDAARTKWCVGAIWFQYRDQDITGRGPGKGERLVHGEHYAFGVVTITDRVKWDLATKMRETNRRAFQWRMNAAENARRQNSVAP